MKILIGLIILISAITLSSFALFITMPDKKKMDATMLVIKLINTFPNTN